MITPKAYIATKPDITFDEDGKLINHDEVFYQGDKVKFPGFGNFIPIRLFGVDENTVFEIVDFYTKHEQRKIFLIYDGEKAILKSEETVMVLLKDQDVYKYKTRASSALYFAEKVVYKNS